MERIGGATLALALVAGPAAAKDAFEVRYETERPGVQNTTATFDYGGVETFETRPTGTGKTFTTDFGTNGKFTGTYKNVQVNSADQFGGAGGTGKYAVTFAKSGYELDLSSQGKNGVNYFGYWLSALDRGNIVQIYKDAKLLFSFSPSDVLRAIATAPDRSNYYGNPNLQFKGRNSGEPYVFLNFYRNEGTFNRIVFKEDPQSGGYESDNHTVGRFKTKGTGTKVELDDSTVSVPEPGTPALLLGGLTLLMWLRRRS